MLSLSSATPLDNSSKSSAISTSTGSTMPLDSRILESTFALAFVLFTTNAFASRAKDFPTQASKCSDEFPAFNLI